MTPERRSRRPPKDALPKALAECTLADIRAAAAAAGAPAPSRPFTWDEMEQAISQSLQEDFGCH
jgi:hypothetical protein